MKSLSGLILSVHLVLAGCASNPTAAVETMNEPIRFNSSAQFYRALQSLEPQLDESEYLELTNSIGILQVHDLDHVTYEDFYSTLNGLSPNEIIKRARILCNRIEC